MTFFGRKAAGYAAGKGGLLIDRRRNAWYSFLKRRRAAAKPSACQADADGSGAYSKSFPLPMQYL
jgi:hypothetical protein